MKFLKGFLVTFLILIIVGGASYIGYTFLFMNHTGHNAADAQVQNTANSTGANENNNAISQSAAILKSKEMLDKSMASLKEALKLETFMQNMGVAYDVNKMQELHNGLYKMSYGMSLLDQLNNDFVSQAEAANANLQDPAVYYSNQYNQAVLNKNKLNQALSNINDAANLININPYIASNGFIYDKDRMNQIHQSIFKLADGVASLNLLNDNLTRQTIFFANTVQSYAYSTNNSNANNASTDMNHSAMTSGLFGGIFDNVSISGIVNIILIIFVIGLILGILGFSFNLIKSPNQGKEV